MTPDTGVFKAVLDGGVLGVTVLLMLTVGMDLESRHFRAVAQRRWAVVGMLVAQMIVLPLLGLATARLLGLPPHLQAGILLIAACPVGDIANFYTLLARGNTALSLVVNALSCLFCAGTMSAIFAAYDRLLPQSFPFVVPPSQLVLRLLLMLLLPVAAGMIIRSVWPAFASRHGRTFRNLSFLGVAFLIAYVLVIRRTQLAADWPPAMLAAGVFMALAFGVGLFFARSLRSSKEEALTTGLLFAARNVGLASAIAITLLGQVQYAVFAAVYFLTEVPLLFGMVVWYRRRRGDSVKVISPVVEVTR